ncbi:probable cytochrome P450 309a2 [Episyrphus balteatus]|uniref:probable cytochrome P450 309a2 n=1 Tax=Episyrphus balteatus TaxID=286459 RepID=UPI0024854292|nr:probable cytochrome P450 309a2 [Episyrphus balteatus]
MEPFLVLFLLLITTLCILVYVYLTWNFNYWKKRGVLGPEPLIIFGTLPSVIKQNRHFVFDMADLYEKYKKCGESFIGIFMTRNPMILVLDTKLVREILIYNFKCFRDNEGALWVNRKNEKIAGRNPFLAFFDEDWKERRNDFMGGISPSRLKQAFPIVTQTGHKMTDFIKAQISKSNKIIDAKSLSFKYTVEIYANFVWGIDTDAFKCVDDEHNVVLNMSSLFMDLSFLKVGLVNISSLMPGLKKLLKNRFYAEETDNFFTQLQNDAVDMRLRNKNNRSDFLNYMLELQRKKNISHVDMVGHSLTVLLDAFDTAAIVIYHALYFLAINQKAQTKLRQEILANLDDKGEISYRALINLEYLDQCVNETIRIVSPIPDFSKICTETTYFENCENKRTKIDRGMIVHISAFAIHHDPDIYHDPEEFIPERFDGGIAKEMTHKGCFLPFGDGPRICAGMRLGLLECKAGVFEIIKNFQLNCCEQTRKGKFIDTESLNVGVDGDIFLEFKELK